MSEKQTAGHTPGPWTSAGPLTDIHDKAMLRRVKVFFWKTWAIDLGAERLAEKAHPYAGPYLLERRDPPLWQRGVPVAFFRTRAEANAVLKRLRRHWPRAKIVRAEVLMQEGLRP